MDIRTGFTGKRPAERWTAISTILLMIFWINYMVSFNQTTTVEVIMVCLVTGIAVFNTGIMTIRLLTAGRVFAVEIRPEVLQIKNTEIEASRVKRIYIKGYFKPVIAIKLKSSLLVQHKHCFCFTGQEDEGIDALQQWADQHQIAVVHRGFAR
ncbi:hypothetical protein MHI24_04020 [Paenibacillus sp. FSL K6-1096]|uniref:hypothetical protein n=1 Tax=Paenibacillus sp. FSL K6-1096 TaxID=2921460 RepID=UPI0030EBEA2F